MDKEEFIQKYAVERKQTNSVKWDRLKERFGDADLLPIWVADMEFSTPETVKEALTTRIAHGVFGYTGIAQDYFLAYQGWQDRHEQTKFNEEWLYFSTGVVQSLYDLVSCFTDEGDAVIIQTPVYYPFFNAVKDQNRTLVTSSLVNREGRYYMDLDDFEAQLKQHRPKLFILCSPHNPLSRVWTNEELVAILALCQKYEVLVVSDEIHSDLISPGYQYQSTITVAQELGLLDQVIILNAPSKTFNLASLLNSHVWIPGKQNRKHYQAWVKKHKQTENSLFGQLAAKVAYETGDDWLVGLQQVIQSNYQWVQQQLNEKLPKIKITPLEGTYLIWLDLRAYVTEAKVKEIVQDQAKLAVDFGEWFSPEAKGFIRLNLATTPVLVEQAVEQLIQAISQQQ